MTVATMNESNSSVDDRGVNSIRMPLTPICGERFKYVCKVTGWTDKKLELMANMSRNTLGKIRSNTDVERSVTPAGEDVDEIRTFGGHDSTSFILVVWAFMFLS